MYGCMCVADVCMHVCVEVKGFVISVSHRIYTSYRRANTPRPHATSPHHVATPHRHTSISHAALI
ncbi:hypothetical protein E2C01_097036 [Portunus trituberculatus]|uniref:Uncharacterized protein n=1 Tax=Portunus trituberculatus TaxID=210409 RepID=A0A5B7K4M0_PORTR|nr:hypothetical protein [Portunus trituberculatus]